MIKIELQGQSIIDVIINCRGHREGIRSTNWHRYILIQLMIISHIISQGEVHLNN